MRPIRFIHAAGFRLDSPYSGVQDPSAAVDERLRVAPFEAFRNLQALCEAEAPDFLLIAGGVFDLADRSIHAQLAFREGLAAIVEGGVPVYLAHGPDDPAAAWLSTIDWPEGVHVMNGRSGWHSVVHDDETIALIQGVSQLSSTMSGPVASDFQAAQDNQVFTVGLAGQIAMADDGEPDPGASLPELHYWALGPERDGAVKTDPSRRILNAGPIQALSPTEIGPHGCYVVESDEAGQAVTKFVALDNIRWDNVTVDVSSLTTDELTPFTRRTVLEVLAGSDGRDLICRLILTGDGATELPGMDLLLNDLRESLHFERPWAWIDRVENLTGTAPISTASGSTPLLTALQARYEALSEDGTLQELVSSASVSSASPLQPKGDDDNPELATRLVRDAHGLAVHRLSQGRGDQS